MRRNKIYNDGELLISQLPKALRSVCDVMSWDNTCLATDGKSGLLCTRAKSHKGDHVACGTEYVYLRWKP